MEDVRMMCATRRIKPIPILLAVLCGTLSGILYLRFYGSVFSFLIGVKSTVWVTLFPRGIQEYLFLIHLFLLEIIFLAIVIILTTCAFGTLRVIEKNKSALISFLSYLITTELYGYFALGKFDRVTSPSLNSVIISVIAFLLFLGSYHGIEYLSKKVLKQKNSLLAL